MEIFKPTNLAYFYPYDKDIEIKFADGSFIGINDLNEDSLYFCVDSENPMADGDLHYFTYIILEDDLLYYANIVEDRLSKIQIKALVDRGIPFRQILEFIEL